MTPKDDTAARTQSVAEVDQQYEHVKQILDQLVDGLRHDVAAESDEAIGWKGTVQQTLMLAQTQPKYLHHVVELAMAAFIRLAKTVN